MTTVLFIDSHTPLHETIWIQVPANQNRLLDFPTIKEDTFYNDYGLPVGQPVEGWKIPDSIPKVTYHGKNCIIEELNKSHAGDLLDAFSVDKENLSNLYKILYKSYGPFQDLATLESWIDLVTNESVAFAIKDAVSGLAIGTAGLIANPKFGSVQLSHFYMADLGSLIATDAMASPATDAMASLFNLIFGLG
jgi:hypothetical protein